MTSPRRRESSHGNPVQLLSNHSPPKYLQEGSRLGAFPLPVCVWLLALNLRGYLLWLIHPHLYTGPSSPHPPGSFLRETPVYSLFLSPHAAAAYYPTSPLGMAGTRLQLTVPLILNFLTFYHCPIVTQITRKWHWFDSRIRGRVSCSLVPAIPERQA